MKIVFITDQPIPNGMAPTNRLLSLATGIYENNCDVEILIINPTESKSNIKNYDTIGQYKGVNYKYVTKTNILPKGIIKKFFVFLIGLFRLIFELRKRHKISKIDAVIILHTWSIYPLCVYFLFIKYRKIIYLHERNEYPFIHKNINIFRKFDYFVYINFVLNKFNGLFVITQNLKIFYSEYISKRARIEVIPMTVEPDRFALNKKDFKQKYIAYCGYIGGNKDGVYHLVEAFSLISSKYPDYFLYIIGDSKNQNDLLALKKIAKDNNVTDKVIFTGKISRDEIPFLLDRAEILALARPNSIQAEGGFPTKLGEYLSTGNPVVVTKVGEIPVYLKHKINAYLAEPDNIIDFANNLEMAIVNQEQSKLIGLKGKELANSVFNNKIQGKNIISLIKRFKDECCK